MAKNDLAIYEMATYLHDRFCVWNHTDGCGWYYENDSWTGYSHKKWLITAQEIVVKVQNIFEE